MKYPQGPLETDISHCYGLEREPMSILAINTVILFAMSLVMRKLVSLPQKYSQKILKKYLRGLESQFAITQKHLVSMNVF